MPYIAFAPLQGYTDAIYRKTHHAAAGGIDEYYTPFLRIEKGVVRGKELRDIAPERNEGVPTVPQVIARDGTELALLLDAVQAMGWQRIDLNMGCPFPMQVRAGRGSGLLMHPEAIREIIQEIRRRKEVRFSVKMRIGQEDNSEGLAALELLDTAELEHITLHPRLGRQQYKGTPDMEAFGEFYNRSHHPIVYNGDIGSLARIAELHEAFPQLKGFMIGRGLLARPWMFVEREPAAVVGEMHEAYCQEACLRYAGETQILSHLTSFWEYMQASLPRKVWKSIMKSRTLANYNAAVRTALTNMKTVEGSAFSADNPLTTTH